MFNAIIPTTPPTVAVQVPAWPEDEQGRAELLTKLLNFFMIPVILVNWDEGGQFRSYGHPCPEHMLTDEDLSWREFELLPEPEIPF
jgi:hypothetical protein